MSTTTNTTTMKSRVSALAPELERIEKASFMERPQLATELAAKMCNLMLEMAERIDELEQHIVHQINDQERHLNETGTKFTMLATMALTLPRAAELTGQDLPPEMVVAIKEVAHFLHGGELIMKPDGQWVDRANIEFISEVSGVPVEELLAGVPEGQADA